MAAFLIADDHAVVRQGLRQMLADEFEGARIDEAGTAEETLDKLKAEPWDLLILDLTMPGRSGLDAIKEIKRLAPKLPVLVFSMHPEDQMAIRVLRAGAGGYLTKQAPPDEMVKAIKTLLGGGRHISPPLASLLADHLQQDIDRPVHAALSDREFQILCLIGAGKTIGHIAEELALSISTVSTYRARILRKMNLANNAELTRYAVEHKLLG